MKRIGIWFLLLLVAALQTFFNPFQKEKQPHRTWQDFVAGIVQPLNEDYHGIFGELASPSGDVSANVETASMSAAMTKRKQNLKAILPNDPLLEREWPVLNDGSFGKGHPKPGADIELAEGWQIEQGDSNVIVAVLDCGVQTDNPEFKGRIWVNKDEIPGNGIDDDENGYVDDVNGWDFIDWDNLPQDVLGHGTNVAGIIAANANNGIGYAGVDWHCKIMPLKVANDQGHGDYGAWARAIRYAVDNGARVINMSLGGSMPSHKLKAALEYAYAHNVVVVAAMMNTNSDTRYYPAAYDHVIAVGATGPDDKRATPFSWSQSSGSNYGDDIDVVAPGGYIYGPSPNQGFDACWSGTSQATPFVSGLASLLIAQNPHRSVDEITHIITATADDQVGDPKEDKKGWDEYYGHGRINVYKALTFESNSANSRAGL